MATSSAQRREAPSGTSGGSAPQWKIAPLAMREFSELTRHSSASRFEGRAKERLSGPAQLSWSPRPGTGPFSLGFSRWPKFGPTGLDKIPLRQDSREGEKRQ